MPSKLSIRSMLSVLVLAALAGCGGPAASPATVIPEPLTPSAESPATAAPDTGTICQNPLFPVRPGASWTYLNTGSPAGAFTYTDTITAITPSGFTVTSQFGDVTYTQEWSCQPEGLQLMQFGNTIAFALSTRGISADLTTSNVTGLTLPSSITPGMQWHYSFDLQGTLTYEGQEAQAEGTVTTSLQEAGSESITVPAGTFDATRIETTSNFDVTASVFGFDVPVEYTTTATLWYAPGVGLVRMTEANTFEGTTLSLTTDLQSYSIP